MRAARMSVVGLGVVGAGRGETSFRDLSVLMSMGSARRAARECAEGSVEGWLN